MTHSWQHKIITCGLMYNYQQVLSSHGILDVKFPLIIQLLEFWTMGRWEVNICLHSHRINLQMEKKIQHVEFLISTILNLNTTFPRFHYHLTQNIIYLNSDPQTFTESLVIYWIKGNFKELKFWRGVQKYNWNEKLSMTLM